jgi:hypothetical protein
MGDAVQSEMTRILLDSRAGHARKALPPRHPGTASSLLRLGRVVLQRGDAVASEPLFREAVEIRRAVLKAGDPLIAEAKSLLQRVRSDPPREQRH